jgi:uncharacterized protein involved in type VI secretion and phage assembly
LSLVDILNTEDEVQTGQIYGVVIGIVTNNKDKEGMGRLKVKFPWRGDSDESYWARVATVMAGKDRGTFFLPEVDDEVLVAFDHGDINHPYKAGHTIVLDDSAGAEKIEIKDKTENNKITIDSVQNSINIESAMQLNIRANVVEIEGTTSLTLKSNAALTIQGLPVKIN